LQAARCALSWCDPIKNLIKTRSIFVDEEGVKFSPWKTVERTFGQECVTC